jgi:hypothetical protein
VQFERDWCVRFVEWWSHLKFERRCVIGSGRGTDRPTRGSAGRTLRGQNQGGGVALTGFLGVEMCTGGLGAEPFQIPNAGDARRHPPSSPSARRRREAGAFRAIPRERRLPERARASCSNHRRIIAAQIPPPQSFFFPWLTQI